MTEERSASLHVVLHVFIEEWPAAHAKFDMNAIINSREVTRDRINDVLVRASSKVSLIAILVMALSVSVGFINWKVWRIDVYIYGYSNASESQVLSSGLTDILAEVASTQGSLPQASVTQLAAIPVAAPISPQPIAVPTAPNVPVANPILVPSATPASNNGAVTGENVVPPVIVAGAPAQSPSPGTVIMGNANTAPPPSPGSVVSGAVDGAPLATQNMVVPGTTHVDSTANPNVTTPQNVEASSPKPSNPPGTAVQPPTGAVTAGNLRGEGEATITTGISADSGSLMSASEVPELHGYQYGSLLYTHGHFVGMSNCITFSAQKQVECKAAMDRISYLDTNNVLQLKDTVLSPNNSLVGLIVKMSFYSLALSACFVMVSGAAYFYGTPNQFEIVVLSSIAYGIVTQFVVCLARSRVFKQTVEIVRTELHETSHSSKSSGTGSFGVLDCVVGGLYIGAAVLAVIGAERAKDKLERSAANLGSDDEEAQAMLLGEDI